MILIFFYWRLNEYIDFIFSTIDDLSLNQKREQ